MKKFLFVAFWLFYAPAVFAFTIATGTPDATYFKIAQDLKGLAEREGIVLNVIATNGSFENISLLGNGKADLAIVQLDALRYFADAMRQEQGLDIFEKVKVVLNLYPEEIHVLARDRNISAFYHLEKKRVSVGPQNSGSALTAELLFRVYDIDVQRFQYSPKGALERLEKGELDAMVFVGGAPVPFFEKLDKPFHFVRLPRNDALGQIYQRKTLGKELYPWVDSGTETYAVHSVIVGLDRKDEKYIETLQRLILSVLNHKEELESQGHPKWKNSLLRFFYQDIGFRPINDVIQIYNLLDSYGYKITKK